MFGNNKKTTTVNLTKKEMQQLTSNMSRSERKAFEKRQRQAENDRFWDTLILADFLSGD